MTNPVTNEDRARAVLREIQQIAFGDADQICFEVEDFGTTVLSAIASALEEAEMRGQNDVWLWLESETVGVQREIVLSQMGRFKRATQKET
jgi:hypothetical protein